MTDSRLSIIVCTYNRSEILKYCLDSLEDQSVDKAFYEVIVVDNNSKDETKEIVEEYCRRNSNFRYVFEPDQGLSHARNRGLKEANADWIGYMDDDAYASPSFYEKVIEEIDKNRFGIFGGVYLPWYKYGKPKWYREIYASNNNKFHIEGVLPETEFVDGGVMFIKKTDLKEVGGFSENLGMKGEQQGYGEETELQIRLRKKGEVIGFCPDITVFHLVPEYKMRVSWFLRSNYLCGRQSRLIFSESKKPRGLLKNVLKELVGLVRILVRNFKKMSADDYYWQNYIIDSFSLSAYNIGKMVSLYKRRH